MRIKSFAVHNFLGVQDAAAELTAPITLIAGPNESGKSSLQEAIRLALLGQFRRVEKKGDLPACIHRGNKRATISVTTAISDDTEETVNIGITPTASSNVPTEKNAELRLLAVWDTEHLTALDPTALRRALFSLANVDLSIDRIIGMASDAGMDDRTVEEIRPYLKAGFPAATQEARQRAQEARAVWKSITGDVYGTQKAEVWAPPIPAMPPGDSVADMEISFRGLAKRVAELEAKLQGAANAETSLKAYREQVAMLESDLATIAPQDGLISGLSEEITALTTEIVSAEHEVREWTPRGEAAEPDAECPACGVALTIQNGRVTEFESGMDTGNPEKLAAAQQSLAALRAAHQKAHDALQRAKDKQRQRDKAEANLNALRLNPPAETPDFDPIEVRATRDALVSQQVTISGQIQERRAVEAARKAIERKVTEAQVAHQDVIRWLRAEELCGPDGLPAKILGRAIHPLNAVLQRSSQLSGWPAIEIAPTIEILYRGFPLALCSESAKWRANAMLVHALAELHGVKTIMLDRMDVLQTSARLEFIKWAQAIHADKGIQFLVFATLKEPPKVAGVEAYWMEAGRMARVD